MQDLKIAAIQSKLSWENVDDNLATFGNRISLIDGHPHLILLPEMFNTGFSMNSAALAEKMGGKTMSWMAEQADQANAVVTGSVIIEDAGKFYNRLLWVLPDGTVQYYNKRHLFRMAHEHEFFDQGSERLIVNYKGWKICPLVCYDLRFPVWSRNDVSFDCLIYVASWPAARIDAWSTLLKARAIENQCYSIGVNRVGKDEANRDYCGGSAVHDPKGSLLSSFEMGKEEVQMITLDLDQLNDFRQKFPVDLDRDQFELKV